MKSDRIDSALERQYRNGYWHGFSSAMNALESVCPPDKWEELAVWFDGALTEWWAGDTKSIIYPPNIHIQP